jgi:pilus assembly protein CpaF
VIVTIAKRSRQVMPLSMLVENGTVDNDVASMLHIAIAGRLNLVVSGGTGSGKTTLLNAMLGLVGEDERVGLLEEVPELMLAQPHVVALYNRAVPHLGRRTSMESFLGLFVEYAIDCEERSIVAEQNRSVEGFLAYLGRRAPQIEASSDEAAISLGMLVRESVRMRFDRIIVGEVRGPEVVDLLGAMNSGFSGSACTIHANSAMEVPSRLQLLAAGHPAHFSPRYVNSLVSQSVDMVIHLGAPEGGQHRVTEVLAVADQVVSESTISTEPLFSWVPGEGWKRVGRMPQSLRRKLEARGMVGVS